MENRLTNKYKLYINENTLTVEEVNTDNIIELKLPDDNKNIRYDMSEFILSDEGSLNGKYIWFTDVNGFPSEVVCETLPFEGLKIDTDYIHIVTEDKQDIFIEIVK